MCKWSHSFEQYCNCPSLVSNNPGVTKVKSYKICFDVVRANKNISVAMDTYMKNIIVSADPTNNLQKLREIKEKQSFSYLNLIHTVPFNFTKSGTYFKNQVGHLSMFWFSCKLEQKRKYINFAKVSHDKASLTLHVSFFFNFKQSSTLNKYHGSTDNNS